MEVSSNPLFTSSARLISNSITLQPFDSKLTAFYTILTVALSIMLSFKQSRYILINATTTYPIRNVKKCIRRLKCLKTGKTYENSDSLINGAASVSTSGGCEVVGNSETSYYRYIRLLKLKRLRKFASNIKYITTNTLNLSSNNYLYKTLNATFTKMKRTATLRRSNNYESGQANGLGVSMGGVRRQQFNNKSRLSKLDSYYAKSLHNCSSMPNFSTIEKKSNDFDELNKICNTNRGMLVRSKSLPKLKFSKVLFVFLFQKLICHKKNYDLRFLTKIL
jgi:hypothetical protein